ncbi:inositol monophosphatase [Marivita sp. GX14005]|uniref:inositol monophosphatase family protein n=1 Tax=Marivita sp. GX14005 TaxID=2942276 RepID=UPI002019374A|nr:inositol monophosphatase [Marivita sp. GX14005]MCL3881139.1 inositol monophosphatase [Marivita sp. GX14005]
MLAAKPATTSADASTAASETLPIAIPSPLTTAQRSQIINLVRRAARAEILPRFRSLDRAEVGEKSGPLDVVTDADRDAEKMIVRGLLRLFPNAHIVGEESATEESIAGLAEAEMGFAIDPVDGTWNFAHGLSTFGLMLAMTRFGAPVFGLIYDPITDEVMIADETGPAEINLRRGMTRRVNVSGGGNIENLSGYVPFSSLPTDQLAEIGAIMPRFRQLMSLKCAAHEFRMVAQGYVDFILCTNLSPWDHAAGSLIIRQAGGHVAMLDGSEYRANFRSGYLLCASDEATWGRVRDAMSFLLEPQSSDDADAS